MRLPIKCCPRYCLTFSQRFSFSQSLVPCLRACDEHSHYIGYKLSVSLKTGCKSSDWQYLWWHSFDVWFKQFGTVGWVICIESERFGRLGINCKTMILCRWFGWVWQIVSISIRQQDPSINSDTEARCLNNYKILWRIVITFAHFCCFVIFAYKKEFEVRKKC